MPSYKIEASNEAENDKKINFWNTLFAIQNQKKIIDFYFNNLRVEFDRIRAQNNGTQQYDSIIKKIDETFKKAEENSEDCKNWITAYQIENYLTHICDEDTLNTDLKRYLSIYKRHFSQQDYDHFERETNDIYIREKKIDPEKKSSSYLNEKRSLLLRLQAELHAFYIKRSEQRKLAFLARIRIAFIFLVGIFAFLMSLIFCRFVDFDQSSKIIILVITSGFFGASFSMLTNRRTKLATASLEDLKVLHRQGYIFARSCIGGGAALITYFLIQANFLDAIISKDLIPVLPVTNYDLAGYKNISLLIIWSFLAGFSERLIPSLLIKIERRIANRN